MTDKPHPGGIGSIGTAAVARVGYGAMQLFETSGEDAAAVLRRAVELGVNHIDTASFYGPGEVNRRIRAALAPYPDDLVIVSKVGARFTGEEPIPLAAAQRPAELRAAVEDDLRQLGLERIPVVNLRRLDLGPGLQAEGDQIVDVDDQLAEMIALRDEGKIGAIGISAVPLDVLRRALPAGIVCVQNAYSLIDRTQEEMLGFCVAEDIAWVPYFPLGSAFPGFPKVADNSVVVDIAGELGATPSQVGLAWVLAHAPNTLLIPGTRSIAHFEENMGAALHAQGQHEAGTVEEGFARQLRSARRIAPSSSMPSTTTGFSVCIRTATAPPGSRSIPVTEELSRGDDAAPSPVADSATSMPGMPGPTLIVAREAMRPARKPNSTSVATVQAGCAMSQAPGRKAAFQRFNQRPEASARSRL